MTTCPTPLKRKYRTEQKARDQVAIVQKINTTIGDRRKRIETKVYRCSCGGHWHLSGRANT